MDIIIIILLQILSVFIISWIISLTINPFFQEWISKFLGYHNIIYIMIQHYIFAWLYFVIKYIVLYILFNYILITVSLIIEYILLSNMIKSKLVIQGEEKLKKNCCGEK